MQKISSITDSADSDNEFTDGSVASGIQSTILPAAWFNTIQRELVKVVEGSGAELNPQDYTQVYTAIKYLINQSFLTTYPVGIVIFFAQDKDPNTLFPGTTWSYIGENKTIRLGLQDGTDVMTTGGADTITLETENLPNHSHNFSATTSQAGGHLHTYNRRGSSDTGNVGDDNINTYDVGNDVAFNTSSVGDHQHTLAGITSAVGNGVAVDIVNAYIKLMGWYRLA